MAVKLNNETIRIYEILKTDTNGSIMSVTPLSIGGGPSKTKLVEIPFGSLMANSKGWDVFLDVAARSIILVWPESK